MIICPWKDIRRYSAVIPGLEEAIAAADAVTDMTPGTVPLSGSNKILIQQGTTKACDGQLIEAHRKFLDIQYIVSGCETMGWAPLDTLTPTEEYNEAKDKCMYAGDCEFIHIPAGYCYVVFPEDGHMPGVHQDVPAEYQKMVIKLKV